MSYELLKNAPPHETPEFLEYLRANNVVVQENDVWLIIENCKYHKPEQMWLTAFHKYPDSPSDTAFALLLLNYNQLEWKKKAAKDQSVKRFHIHMYEPNSLQKGGE